MNTPINGDVNTFISKLENTGRVKSTLVTMPAKNVAYLRGSFAGISNCFFLASYTPLSKTVYKVTILTESKTNWLEIESTYDDLLERYKTKYNLKWQQNTLSMGAIRSATEIERIYKYGCSVSSAFEAPAGNVYMQIKANSSDRAQIEIIYIDKQNLMKSQTEDKDALYEDL